MLALRALEQALLRGAASARRSDRGAAEKSPRPAVLILSRHGGTYDDDVPLDRLADLRGAGLRGQTGQRGGEAIGGDMGQRGRGVIRMRSADAAWRTLHPAPRAAKPKATRPSGRRTIGAVLRTRPSDSGCRSRTPTRAAPTAARKGPAGGMVGKRAMTTRSRLRASVSARAWS